MHQKSREAFLTSIVRRLRTCCVLRSALSLAELEYTWRVFEYIPYCYLIKGLSSSDRTERISEVFRLELVGADDFVQAQLGKQLPGRGEHRQAGTPPGEQENQMSLSFGK